ncbi:MAG TPA: four helix bundle protein [bacterium]|nr:four helix bundle protein [bacterium]
MSQYDHLQIFRSSYKLTLEIYKASHNFPREYKYTLGQKLKDFSSDFINLIILANSQKEKSKTLEDARLKLEQLKIHIRLSSDLKILGINRFELFAVSIEEISKQLSGWYDWSSQHTMEQK